MVEPCSADHGGAVYVGYPEPHSVWIFSGNRVEYCSIINWCGTGWYFFMGSFPQNGEFLFSKCKCIANTGGDSAGAVTFHNPPESEPSQFSIKECQFIGNTLTASSIYGGAGMYFHLLNEWINGTNIIIFCFFDGNSATNGRGNDIFFSISNITQSPFQQCGSTTEVKRVWNQGTADNSEYNSWLPIINQNKIVANFGTDADACGKTQQSPCATVEYALGWIAPFSDASLSLLVSTFTPTETLTFRAPNTKITGNGIASTIIASSGIPQPQNSHSHSSQSSQSTSSFSLFSSSSSPDPSASSALFQQIQGSLTVSALTIAHNSTNQITPILFHLSDNSPSLNLNTTTITGTTSITIKTPLFFLTAGSLALNHTSITQLALNSQSIFHLTSLTAPFTLNSSSITDITSTASPASCVLSSATSPALSLSLANCTITNINSAPQHQQTSTNGGCISFASSASANTFSVSDTTFSSCSVSEDTSSGGRGGALMIEFNHGSQVSESSFSITNIVFSANKASVGREMYFVCNSLVASVKEPLFAFMGNITQKDNSIVGHDKTEAFGDWNVDLFIFFDGFFDDTIYVDGTSGVEKEYCGLEKAPCLSVNYGMEHLKKTQNTKQEIVVCEKSNIAGCVDVGGMHVKAKAETIVEIECQREVSGSEACVLKSLSLTELEFIGIVVPSSFNRTITSVIESSTQNGELHMKNCEMSVVGGKENTIGLFLIKSTGKIVELDSVTISDVKSSVSLFSFSLSSANMNEQEYKVKLLNCTMEGFVIDSGEAVEGKAAVFGGSLGVGMMINGSTIDGALSKKSKEGGALKIELNEGGYVTIQKSSFVGCVCENENNRGKGGGIYMDCQSCLNERPFLFESVTFESNNAAFGKNVFILGKDFNSSVTNESFKFDYSSMKDDKTLFVGNDDFHQEKDLFMFLIPYKSFEIFISSEGFDVARCGSEEEPCFTMWKGMENMKEGDEMKTILIEGSTIIQDSFNVSNYQIKKSVKMGEEDIKAILNFEKATDSQLEYFMENDIHLELSNIQLQLASGFDNSAKTIISNKNRELVIIGCSFHSEAGASNGFDCVFVDVIGGSVEVNDLSMESSNSGNSIFVIHNAGIVCHFVNVRVESLNESGGCILSIKKSESGLKINEGGEDCANIEIDNSSFSGVKRSGNGASILESTSGKKICLIVNESNITEDKSEDSEKGGAIFFTLCVSGSMKMIDSTISHCSCSESTGKGGGVYLATKERGELNFTFVVMKFSDNGASVGKDIFIECFNITSQINESQFQFDLREGHYSRINAIYGRDECDYPSDTDLIGFVTIHQSDTIVVSSVDGSNERQCGTNTLPCYSIDYGLMHLTSDFISLMFIVEESVIGGEMNLKEMSLSSKSRGLCEVEVKSNIGKTRETLMGTIGTVSLARVNFVFDSNFISSHESLISPEGGILEIINCSFSSKQSAGEGNIELAYIPLYIINTAEGELQLDGCTISNLVLHEAVLYLSSALPSTIDSLMICNSTVSHSLVEIIECGQLNMEKFHLENITVEGNEESLISCLSMKKTMQLTNCTIGDVSSKTVKGKLMKVENSLDVKMDSCIFDGSSKEINEKNLNEGKEMCRWEGSLVDVVKSSVMMKDTTISNSHDGGLAISGGNVIIEKGEFIDNNPLISNYPSLRRNIVCSDSGVMNVMSLKGGDGWERNTSLWVLDEGCELGGIVSERASSFFIPIVEEARNETASEGRTIITLSGRLLLPCDVSLKLSFRNGREEVVESYGIGEKESVSENEIVAVVSSVQMGAEGAETEVSASLLFGKGDSPSSTGSFILKNRSETEGKGDDRIVEEGKEGKSFWPIIVVVMAIILLIVLIVSVVLAIRWRKQKRRTEELEVIVEDTVKKDPKAFEMVTMEMSPEEQWRREERETEKKNEERIKKRVYEKSLGHSESSEHLLSESGSTEYILGKDSDKIPEWMLEKVDEKEVEEETRKRTPSPSISSTSTTDTSDTESTFVRSESLCPTTSSMSNLVDAMACSSPHEKLIVDLRDSLFMLLHGRNEKKEMAIGSLQEREQTAAQILFWVANLALHSFDEMENPLSSLTNLSPHIVLFSEHMVICIVMHSDFSSSDSDSSSTSSSTVVTSASDDDDDDDRDSLPSSAFEDEDDFRKECLRWKAPELLVNRKMGATKESVAFSIGMMLWECLTLEIPFGECGAEVVGQKIVNGEKPDVRKVGGSSLAGVVKGCLSQDWGQRPSVNELKREFIVRFPKGAAIMTMTDAICVREESMAGLNRSMMSESEE
ncbi:uncharacterized protein MONOS_4213 [Monocercomonoides exilis]|uniref:uncharacterized protein n=1 Tax=Monocercomonoides exilis TaxID=2049356 RepID=UPI00355A0BF6|nr:hypothetical protein MONOS_4213 [Monocercomonoides exilis]|eukprot:MONOS_4213.1-p1 / transcript=MONOS_4213.1 / gene=MONOS_4213 / organism=Monocercomonoides_exilis_PA203 / gene_product=unspecified product / transcript_product=unspecified product / location=Mono_scaffold00109:43007-49869(-) / protein_length=2269 / sequence_SO=supercontig / SO=protein_coding / is_pseudo=false